MNITGKDIFGYLLLVIIGLFGAAMIFREVNQTTTYGLQELFAILAVVAGAYMQSYVGEHRGAQREKDEAAK